MGASLPFNRVVVRSAQGERNLTVAEFAGIPLTERVRAVLERRVEFFHDQQSVAVLDALRALREQ